jgi:hypothetical protein
LKEVTQVLDFEYGVQPSFERREPSSIIARGGNVVHVEGDHGENVSGAEDVDARVRYALLPPVIDKPFTQEHVELVRVLFRTIEVAFEMTHFTSAIGEAEGFADVHVLVDGSVEERSVDVKMTKLKVLGASNGEEESETGHANVSV